jgi:phage host-nuclease inhibitor protein Gam
MNEVTKIDETTFEVRKTVTTVSSEIKTIDDLLEEELSLQNQLAAYTHNTNERLSKIRAEILLAKEAGVNISGELTGGLTEPGE